MTDFNDLRETLRGTVESATIGERTFRDEGQGSLSEATTQAAQILDQKIRRIVAILVRAERNGHLVDVVHERPEAPAIRLVRLTMIGIEIGRVTATWPRPAGGERPPRIDIAVKWSGDPDAWKRAMVEIRDEVAS